MVVGYGTTTKRDLTGSITTINADDFVQGVVTTPEQLIAGKAAGVQITSNGGAPGAGGPPGRVGRAPRRRAAGRVTGGADRCAAPVPVRLANWSIYKGSTNWSDRLAPIFSPSPFRPQPTGFLNQLVRRLADGTPRETMQPSLFDQLVLLIVHPLVPPSLPPVASVTAPPKPPSREYLWEA